MEQLINYIENIVKLDSESISELKNLTVIKTYQKNQHILEPGQYCDKIWFLKSGMVRKYHYHDGKDITIWIHTENETFTSLQSYAQQKPAAEYLQACEPVEVISISRENSKKLAQFPQFITFSNAVMEREFVNINIHTKEFNTKDARGKYEYLRKIAPEMVKRAKLGHIASLIGITQETLSRVRKSK